MILIQRFFYGLGLCCLVACAEPNQVEERSDGGGGEEVRIALAPDEVVLGFIDDLGRKDFETAWSRTNGQRWGDVHTFSSVKAFGSIYKTEVHELKEISNDGENATVYADASYYSSQQNHRYQEDFYLKRLNGEWKIVRFQVKRELPLAGN
jgi:hypothetical protein